MTNIMVVAHTPWFSESDIKISTVDGKAVRVIDFLHRDDEAILKLWAKHFREHYVKDENIDEACVPMGLSRSEYLQTIKFPSEPHIISGEFSEILVADYIEFILNYLVPRTRYNNKTNRNTSPHGVDVIAFKFIGEREDRNDELLTCEIKATLVKKNKNKFQEAVNHSKKDYNVRLPEALNAMRQRLKELGNLDLVKTIERFQNRTSRPYKAITGAALVCSDRCWSEDCVSTTDSTHPNDNLYLFVIKGDSLMDLAKRLYELAYVTA